MRRLILLPLALVACAALVSAANAGQADINANGDMLAIDASLSPPVTSSPGFSQPVTLEVHTAFGNIYGNPTPGESASINFGLPKGIKFNGKDFPACPLPTADTQLGDATRCPKGSQVGKGTITVDARRIKAGNRVEGTLKVFNGAVHNKRRTLFLMAAINVGGTPVPAESDFDVVGNELREFDYMNRPRGMANFDITRADFTAGKTRKVNGKLVGLLVAPKTCPGKGWPFSLTAERDSSSQTATDTSPCIVVK